MSSLTRTDILIHIVYGMDCPNGLLQLYLTCFDHYAPGCRWKKIVQIDGFPIQTDDSVRYVLKTRAEHVLMGMPRWDVIEEALEMMDSAVGIQSINLTPLAQMENPIDDDWRICSGTEEGVTLLRLPLAPAAAAAAAMTIPHLAWVRDGTHANALLLGPWPVRLDVIQGGELQMWVLEFAEREGILLRGPSLR